jgi:hypothetical protein
MPPPTRAKSAIEEAPREKPERMFNTSVMAWVSFNAAGYIFV